MEFGLDCLYFYLIGLFELVGNVLFFTYLRAELRGQKCLLGVVLPCARRELGLYLFIYFNLFDLSFNTQ